MGGFIRLHILPPNWWPWVSKKASEARALVLLNMAREERRLRFAAERKLKKTTQPESPES